MASRLSNIPKGQGSYMTNLNSLYALKGRPLASIHRPRLRYKGLPYDMEVISANFPVSKVSTRSIRDDGYEGQWLSHALLPEELSAPDGSSYIEIAS
jgi:hypothetical protein